MYGIVCRNRNRFERKPRGARQCFLGKRTQAHCGGTGAKRDHATDKTASGDGGFDNAIKVAFGRARIVMFVPLIP